VDCTKPRAFSTRNIAYAAITISALMILTGSAYLAGRTMTRMDHAEILRTASDASDTNETRLAESDLWVQEDMAVAAWFMVFITIASTAVGAAGVAAVVVTIRQNRSNMLELRRQNEISEQRIRPLFKILEYSYELDETNAYVFLKLENIGQSAALDIRISGQLEASEQSQTILTWDTSDLVIKGNTFVRQPINAGETRTDRMPFSYPAQPTTDDDSLAGLIMRAANIGKRPKGIEAWKALRFSGVIEFTDILGHEHTQRFHCEYRPFQDTIKLAGTMD